MHIGYNKFKDKVYVLRGRAETQVKIHFGAVNISF